MDIQPTIDNQQMLPQGIMLHGTYRIDRYLASGGFGNTYLATNEFDETVVVKEFYMRGISERAADHCSVTVSQTNHALFHQQCEKLKKEAKRLRQLHNSHIVKVHSCFEENNTVYYVMDYIDGMSLSEKMKQQGHPFKEEEVLPVISALGDALEAVHAVPLQHLDIKPGNIMCDRQGNIFLIDFGASKQIGAEGSHTTTTSTCYTPGYAPIEQVDQLLTSIGPWTDIYAVGATVYNLLTSQKPPLSAAITLDEADAFSFPPSVSERMRHFILTCMQPKYRLRPQNVADMLQLLQPAEQVMPTEPSVSELQVEEVTVLASSSPAPTISDIHYQQVESNSFAEKKPQKETPITPHQPDVSQVTLKETMEVTPEGHRIFIVNGVAFKMIKVEAGTFQMGSDSGNNNEKPAHQVTLTKDYYIGEIVVTQTLWQAVMVSLPQDLYKSSLDIKGPFRPVCYVNWDDCQMFIEKLNQLTGEHFRLPTEAEWEYAARGGNKTNGHKYSGSDNIEECAWCSENVRAIGCKNVSTKVSNELGIYDMSGNVWEWCNDWYGEYSSSASQNDPTGSTTGSFRVLHGGSWDSLASHCRCTCRDYAAPASRYRYIGFRLAL